VLSLVAAQAGMETTDGECRILMRREGKLVAAEFQVRVTPLEQRDETFLAMVLMDVSDQKRKEVFERLFFHDLVNTIQCLEGWSVRLEAGLRDPVRASAVLVELIQRLTGQVRHHKLLMQAERGELQLHFCPVEVSEMLDSLRQSLQQHELARRRFLEIVPPAEGAVVVTDRELLQRVLTNMVVNALEATAEGESVKVWHEAEDGRSGFHVQNPGVIAPEVAMQIFHRSFSTKGGYGRGLGTYGMKLLGEDHLGGVLTFRSTELEGTRFSIVLPRNPPAQAKIRRHLEV
jgi:signal transduction histidine kinase